MEIENTKINATKPSIAQLRLKNDLKPTLSRTTAMPMGRTRILQIERKRAAILSADFEWPILGCKNKMEHKSDH